MLGSPAVQKSRKSTQEGFSCPQLKRNLPQICNKLFSRNVKSIKKYDVRNVHAQVWTITEQYMFKGMKLFKEPSVRGQVIVLYSGQSLFKIWLAKRESSVWHGRATFRVKHVLVSKFFAKSIAPKLPPAVYTSV